MSNTIDFYARVSTEEQRERSTIDAQITYAQKRAEAEGWKLRLFLDDGISGTIRLRERPAGAELLQAAKAKEITIAATYKLDRLGRVASVIRMAPTLIPSGRQRTGQRLLWRIRRRTTVRTSWFVQV